MTNNILEIHNLSKDYGDKYADALGKAEKGDWDACCMPGQMFKEPICHTGREGLSN